MSKSLKRVNAALEASGASYELREMPDSTRTAQEAADSIGCALDQIAKSIVVEGEQSGSLTLFVTAGGNRVCTDRITELLGEPTHPASGARIRAVTGFAIGGVSPIGHKAPIRAFFDPRLGEFETVWAAAGTPRHVFGIAPEELRSLQRRDGRFHRKLTRSRFRPHKTRPRKRRRPSPEENVKSFHITY